MRDRIAAVGGRLRIDSTRGGGTRVCGHVRTLPDHVPEEVERLVVRAADALTDAMGIYRAVQTASGRIVDFAVEHVNDAACKSAGLPRDAQVGRTLGQLRPGYPNSPSFRWHCEALEADTPLIREEFEYTGIAGDRRLRRAYEVRAAGLGAGRLALVWRDITTRKRAEHALRLMATALGRERDGVCVVRAATKTIVYANPYLEQMFHYGSGELEGRRASVLDWVGGPDESTTTAPPRSFRSDQFVAKCRRKDGSAIVCEVTIDGFDDADLGWCWVAAHHDISAEVGADERARREREQLGSSLRTLPALGWSCDPDLRSTLLFDNLVVPGRAALPLSGDDLDLFGPALAPHISELNLRVVVTGRAAQVAVEAELEGGHRVALVLVAEPVHSPRGEITGAAGSALQRPAAERPAHAGRPGGGGRHRRARRASEQ
jgi:PAS domain-containing protein